MNIIDTKRILKSGLLNFRRNGIVSFASVLVMTITLSVLTAILFTQAILHNSLEEIQNKVDVSIYFTTTASEEKIMSMKDSLEKLAEISSVSYVSAEQALTDFREKHKDDYLTLQALEELADNPLGASLNIKAKDTTQYEAVVKVLEGDSALAKDNASIIDRINYYQNKVVIDSLTSIIKGAKQLGLLITIILVIISIIITFNTVRLTMHFSQEEISVMRLVGAGNKYIRGPFMVEGIVHGILATIFTMVIYLIVSAWMGKNLSSFLGINLFNYYLSNFFQILLIVLGSGVFLGAFSSFLAIRKYLRR
jgi:cell division transport system permease protein